ncbi:Ung [Buchnera aphidicola str. G002 (Myzus persicae)]|uniref:Uracil-DNA glycosylase n=1 Tax=Buchnera aphidicola str. USDA (Myzus persicae) TaxID=1009856 RepID=W0P0E4_BUCMP|nr:Ung [Buchnera aphidicola str. USDA (Myzus persicae)]AHG60768.1 Ung [Buchnera aphidicola str. W106 (Myzus persicae)]AHG61340.1 Ung [Buchnera aphidicola str. G002 (Myzus persicae)]AHG61913.1 Ung [Buchnera aphidicola str. F009 (Myzus persicae)]
MIKFIKQQRLKKIIYPDQKYIFNAFLLTNLNDIKVVILGQDPYFSQDQAHGLSFSVPKNSTIPPSLKNIYKELNSDFKKKHIFNHGCLQNWATQGVFLLNTILTVESGKPKSHSSIGWHIFTDKVISIISSYRKSVVFLLWGKDAQKKRHLININNHYILKSPHPSPLSAHRGFFGCKHFSLTNKILSDNKKKPIDWFLI